MFNPYVKAIIAGLIALVGALSVGYEDGTLTTSEIVVAITAAIVALGAVWATPQGKAIVGAVVAGLGALGIALADDAFSYAEVITVIGAVLVAFAGVYEYRNTAAGNAPNPPEALAASSSRS